MQSEEQQNSQTNLSTQQELPLRLRQSQNSQTRVQDSSRRRKPSVQSPKVVIGVNMGKSTPQPQHPERGKASELKTYSEHTCRAEQQIRHSNNTPVINTDLPINLLLPPPAQLRVLTPPAESLILTSSPHSPVEAAEDTM